MHQTSFRFYDIDPEQLSFDFPIQEQEVIINRYDSSTFCNVGIGTTSPALKLNIDSTTINGDCGLYLRQDNKSWLKTKIAGWLGINYL